MNIKKYQQGNQVKYTGLLNQDLKLFFNYGVGNCKLDICGVVFSKLGVSSLRFNVDNPGYIGFPN